MTKRSAGGRAGSRHDVETVLAQARCLADDVLFPAAIATDRADLVPASHLDALADAGLYGAAGPVGSGGLDLPLPAMTALIEILSGGCLTTAFVWIQHHGLVRAVAMAHDTALRDRWLADLCQGRVRAGVVFAGVIPGPPRLRARRTDGGWELRGIAEWVSGWGRVDVLLVKARGPEDTLVLLAVDAEEQPGLTARRLDLVAVNASGTVTLDFDGARVSADRHIASTPFDPAADAQGTTLRLNGSLALGVAGRACRLLGSGALDDRLQDRRRQLDTAPPELMPGARAAASAFAARATTMLVTSTGARAVLADNHAQRLAREAMFLLVFGSREAIKAALLNTLTTGTELPA